LSAVLSAHLFEAESVTLMHNPVMFVVEVGAALTTVFLSDLFGGGIDFHFNRTCGSGSRCCLPTPKRGRLARKAQADTLRKPVRMRWPTSGIGRNQTGAGFGTARQ
jgi:hypothetical protein